MQHDQIIQEKLKKKLNNTLFAVFYFLSFGCSKQETKTNFQETITYSSNKSEEEKIYLDLNKNQKSKIKKICIQNFYMPKEFFQEATKIEPINFQYINEDTFSIWIFQENGEQTTINLRKKILIPNSGEVCTTSPLVSINQRILFLE